MRVRRATVADAMAIAVVQVRSWQAAYRGLFPQDYLDGLDAEQRRAVWEQGLAETHWPSAGALVIEVDVADSPRIIGFAYFGPTRDEGEDPATVGEIFAIYLSPDAWGTGAGRYLMSSCVRVLADAGYREAVLWVLHTNERARRFYEAAGWQVDGALRHEDSIGVAHTDVRYRRQSIQDP